jgi:predicted CXXCH cytochrome family protein
MRRRIMLAVIVLICVTAGLAGYLARPSLLDSQANSGANVQADALPFPLELGPRSQFATSSDCQSCHPDQHSSWHATYHRTMTQLASAETVVAPFDGVTLSDYRQSAELERRGDEFWVRMIDHEPLLTTGPGSGLDDLPRVDRKVVMTTGSHHFQAYWTVEKEGEELWLFPWRYHIAAQRWIHRRDVFLQPPIDVPQFHHKIWNGECIDCHSTGGRPGLDMVAQQYVTKVAELGISCEACHGPAKEHISIATASRDAQLNSEEVTDWKIVNPSTLDARKSTQVCGQCHSDTFHLHADHVQVGKRFVPGQDMNQFLRLTTLGANSDPAYWGDGVCRAGGREYNALVRSDCHTYGSATCLSCHSMHSSDPNDQLAGGMNSDDACFQCHEEYREKIQEHTHHAPQSSGSLCFNCHMPHTSFALLKGIRNHQIGSPQASAIVPDGRPNACNLCHIDKSLSWTAEHLTEWYGQPDVKLDQDESEIAASLIWMLRGDAAQRVVSSWHMGWNSAHEAAGNDWIAPHLARLLNDDYAAVRWVAAESLKKLPGFDDFKYEYDEPEERRRQSIQAATERWTTLGGAAPGQTAPEVLLTPTRELRSDVVDRLLRQQDTRPVGILE